MVLDWSGGRGGIGGLRGNLGTGGDERGDARGRRGAQEPRLVKSVLPIPVFIVHLSKVYI